MLWLMVLYGENICSFGLKSVENCASPSARLNALKLRSSGKSWLGLTNGEWPVEGMKPSLYPRKGDGCWEERKSELSSVIACC